MSEKKLSVFVDESGNFGCPDPVSRFYVIGLVFHDQDHLIGEAVADLDLALRDMGISHHYFHAGPMIRLSGRRRKPDAFRLAGLRAID